MELGVQDPQNGLTADRAAQSVDYWRNIAQQLLSDPQTPDGSDPRKAYAKMVSAQASLLLEHNYSAEAEQAFRIANEIYPASPEVVFRYVQLLMDQNRRSDALPIIENALRADPNRQELKDLLNRVKSQK
jgi:predicted Zn-dependent protease